MTSVVKDAHIVKKPARVFDYGENKYILSVVEVNSLIAQAKNGNMQAKERLYEKYGNAIRRIANRFYNGAFRNDPAFDLDDLIQTGFEQLSESINNYNSNNKTCFTILFDVALREALRSSKFLGMQRLSRSNVVEDEDHVGPDIRIACSNGELRNVVTENSIVEEGSLSETQNKRLRERMNKFVSEDYKKMKLSGRVCQMMQMYYLDDKDKNDIGEIYRIDGESVVHEIYVLIDKIREKDKGQLSKFIQLSHPIMELLSCAHLEESIMPPAELDFDTRISLCQDAISRLPIRSNKSFGRKPLIISGGIKVVQEKVRNNVSFYSSALGKTVMMPRDALNKLFAYYRRNQKVTAAQSVPNEIIREDDIQYAEDYLESYQSINKKRKSDLTREDLQKLSLDVRNALKINTLDDLVRVSKSIKTNDTLEYHVVQIRWNHYLENELRRLLQGVDNPAEFIKNNSKLVWEELGTTSFAAIMKARELGIIKGKSSFGHGFKRGQPIYPFVDLQGYGFSQYIPQTAKNIETTSLIATHMFLSPRHRQNVHINIPISYKGVSVENYSKKEADLLTTMQLFVNNPNKFKKESKITIDGENNTWLLVAPQHITTTPKIVPIRVNSALYTQISTPVNQIADPGGIRYTQAVKSPNGAEIYVFYDDK